MKVRMIKTRVGGRDGGTRDSRTGDLVSDYFPSRNPLTVVSKSEDGDVESSRQLTPDEAFIERLIDQGRIVPPPHDIYGLACKPEESAVLGPCIDAYVVNCESFGWDLDYIGPEGREDSDEAKKEKREIRSWLRTCNDREKLEDIRSKLRHDYETGGIWYMEILRGGDGLPAILEHIPAYTMRIGAQDRRPIPVDVQMIGDDGEVITKKIHRRFRRYVQIVEHRRVWFKELGDPREYSWKTGKEVDPQIADEEDLATEIVCVARYNPRSPYGSPRYVGALPAIVGNRYAEMVNLRYFERNAIPAMMVLVSGGKLDSDSFKALTDYFQEEAGGIENMHRAIVLEAVPAEGSTDEKANAISVKAEPMMEARQTDAQFLEYDVSNAKKVRESFRLPESYLGSGEGSNFATSMANKITAEEQVFSVERGRFDTVMNLQVFRAHAWRFWAFRSKGPEIADVATYTAAVQAFNNVGAMTANQAIRLSNELLGTDQDEIKEAWADFPFVMVMELLGAGKLDGLDAITRELEEPEPAGEADDLPVVPIPSSADGGGRPPAGSGTSTQQGAKVASIVRKFERAMRDAQRLADTLGVKADFSAAQLVANGGAMVPGQGAFLAQSPMAGLRRRRRK